jgi:RNA polymerase sigma-70 factor, ECF subfamily
MGAETNERALTPIDLAADDEGRAEPATTVCVRLARAGDVTAFAELVGCHERMVLRTALRLLGAIDRAQDAAQETFLRMHRYLGRFDESRELGPWLYRTVVNVCHDLARRSPPSRHISIEELREAEHPTTRGGPDAIDALEREQQRQLVQEALMTLPRKERAAIVLRDIEGRSTSDVARILGSSEGTVRSQISTARVKIKRFIEQKQESRR